MAETFFLKAEVDTEGILGRVRKIMELARELEKEAYYLKCGETEIRASETSCEIDHKE